MIQTSKKLVTVRELLDVSELARAATKNDEDAIVFADWAEEQGLVAPQFIEVVADEDDEAISASLRDFRDVCSRAEMVETQRKLVESRVRESRRAAKLVLHALRHAIIQ